jgi:nicotinamidase-related amidase
MNTALLLIDLQNDYFPGGAMTLHGAEAAVQQAAHLLQLFRAQHRNVVHVQHISTRVGATFFLPHTPGAEIHAAVRPTEGEAVVVKHHVNSFRETNLLQVLRAQDVTHLVIAGMMTQQCVDTAVRAAADLGFQCTLAADACATLALEYGGQRVSAQQVQTAFMASLQNARFARVVPTQVLCDEYTASATLA